VTDDLLSTIRDTWDTAAPSYDKDPGHGLMSEDERQHWLRITGGSFLATGHCAFSM
jgi:hypothetical protein